MGRRSNTVDGMRRCGTCERTLGLAEYHQRPDGYHRSECKRCWKDRSDRHKEVYDEWYDSLKRFPCLDCGVDYPPYTMIWDHLPQFEKTMNVSKMRVKRLKKEILLAEIAKCELVCSNCHTERTHQRHQRPLT